MGLSQKAKHHISPFPQPCGWSCNITAQTRLLGRGGLETAEQVAQLIVRTQEQIEAIENPRSILYNKLRRCNDPEEQKTLKDQRDGCTQQLSQLRKDRKNAQIILDQTPERCRCVGVNWRCGRELNQWKRQDDDKYSDNGKGGQPVRAAPL